MYEQHHFADADALAAAAEELLASDASDGAPAAAGDDEAARGRVTHVAIEGRDLELRMVWEAAAERAAARRGDTTAATILDISPEAWRRDLLLPRERHR